VQTKHRHETQVKPPACPRDRRILLVEDNELNRELAAVLLDCVGITVVQADDGAAAVEAVAANPYGFALILMDLQMPKMDGLEACRQIRRLPGGQAVPIIAMTANVMPEHRQSCLAAGMNDHLGKPIRPDALYDIVMRWCPAVGGRAAPNVSGVPWLPETLPPFDLPTALCFAGGNASLLRRMIQGFPRSYADFVAQVSALITAGEGREAMRQAHSLKGAARTLGLPALAALAADLETALEAGQSEVLASSLAAISAELAPAVTAAKQLGADEDPAVPFP